MLLSRKSYIVFYLGVLLFLANHGELKAQDEPLKVIQFSGVVVNQDSSAGVPGAHLYVPKARRGTSTNYYGYFSFPVLEGDSIIISSVGYHKKHIIIPKQEKDNLTIVIPMMEDTTYLREVEIMPYPTEELFKEAILAYRLPNQEDINSMDKNLAPEVLAEIYRNTGMDGSMNYRYFMQQQVEYMHDAYGPRPNRLLNPFAWAEFFRSLKKKK